MAQDLSDAIAEPATTDSLQGARPAETTLYESKSWLILGGLALFVLSTGSGAYLWMNQDYRGETLKFDDAISPTAVTVTQGQADNQYPSGISPQIPEPTAESPTPTTRKLQIRQTLAYRLPRGWKDVAPVDADPSQLFFEAGDSKENPDGYGRLRGASAAMSVYYNVPFMTARQRIEDIRLRYFLNRSPDVVDVEIGNMQGVYSKVTWEGTSHEYIVATKRLLLGDQLQL